MEKYNKDLTRLAKGSGLSAIGDFFVLFVRLPMAFLTTHLFNSTALFGLYEFAFRATFFVRIIILPGTYEAIRRFLPMFKADGNKPAVKGLLIYSFKLTAVLSLSVSSLLFIFAPRICSLLNQPEAYKYLRIFSITLPFYAFLYISVGAFTGIHRVKPQVFIEKIFVYGIRLLILFAFMFTANQKVRSFAVLWSFPIAFGIGCFIALFLFFRTFKVVRDRSIKPEYHIREFHMYSLPLAATGQINYLISFAGTFIIGYYCTKTDIGLYGIVTHLSPLLSVALYSSVIAFGPLISELYHLGRKDELARHYKFITKWVFTFSLIIFVVYLLMTNPVLSVFGKGYSNSRTRLCLILMSFAQLYSTASGPNGMILSMTGKQNLNFYNSLLLMIISISLGFILVPNTGMFGGIVGAAIAQTIAIVGINTLCPIQLWHYRRMHPFSIAYLKPIVAGLLSYGIIYLLMHITGYGYYLNNYSPEGTHDSLILVFYVGICALLVLGLFAFFLFLFGLEDDDKFILRKLLTKITGTGIGKPQNTLDAIKNIDLDEKNK